MVIGKNMPIAHCPVQFLARYYYGIYPGYTITNGGVVINTGLALYDLMIYKTVYVISLKIYCSPY